MSGNMDDTKAGPPDWICEEKAKMNEKDLKSNREFVERCKASGRGREVIVPKPEQKTFNQGPWKPNNLIGGTCMKCGHVHMSIICSCGCDISGELLVVQPPAEPQGDAPLSKIKVLVEQLAECEGRRLNGRAREITAELLAIFDNLGGTVGLDGDTKRDWETDGPAWERRALEAEAKLRASAQGQPETQVQNSDVDAAQAWLNHAHGDSDEVCPDVDSACLTKAFAAHRQAAEQRATQHLRQLLIDAMHIIGAEVSEQGKRGWANTLAKIRSVLEYPAKDETSQPDRLAAPPTATK